MSKVDRALHGPGWGEVIFGAVLSLVLGVVIGAVLLILKPVVIAHELPKEPVPGAVYYIEGSRSGSSGRQALAKRKAFTEGQTVKFTEDEVNALAEAATANKNAKPAATASTEVITPGTPNVRIHDNVVQIGVPVTLSVFGFDEKIIVQARGGFEKEGNEFTYVPSVLYLGSCPVQRLPFLSSYVRNKVLAAQPIPEDIATAWSKLSNVSVEGNSITLAMQ